MTFAQSGVTMGLFVKPKLFLGVAKMGISAKKSSESKVAKLLYILLPLLYFTSYVTRINFSAVMADMISVGVLNKEQAGIIGSALFFTYGFGQIASGILGDRLSPHRIICTGLVITVICNFLMPITSSPILMAVIWGFNGIAQAFFWPPIIKLMTMHLSESEYSRCALFISFAMNMATILIYAVVPVCTALLNWKVAFVISAIWAAIFFVVWILGYHEVEKQRVHKEITPHEKEEDQEIKPKGIKLSRVFIVSGMFYTCVAIALQGFLRDGIQSWLPTFFTEVFKMSSASAIFSTVLIPIFNIFVTYIAVFLFNKVFKNEVKASLCYYALTTVLCGVLSVFYRSSPVICLVISATVTGLIHGINSMLTTFLARRFGHTGKVSTVIGVANASTYIGSTASSYGIAVIAENLGWQATLISWAIIALLGTVCCIIALPKWTRFIKENQN